MKVCTRCHIEKEDADFRKQVISGKSYLRSHCKNCSKEYLREWGKNKTRQRRIAKVVPLPMHKACTRCKKTKPQSDFRTRIEKRAEPHWEYLNPTCRLCDKELSRERVQIQRSTPEGREKHNKWALEFHARHREKCLAEMKKRRDTPEYKAHMKEYRDKRKDIIYQQEVVTKKRYARKHIDALTDEYVIRKLVDQNVADKETLIQHPEIIEAKRLQILIKRKIKQHGHTD